MKGMIAYRARVIAFLVVLCGACGPTSETPSMSSPASMEPWFPPTDPHALALDLVIPAAGPKTGGIALTLSGANFSTGVKVNIGGVAAPVVAVSSATQLTVTLPAWSGAWSTVPVVIENPDGQQVTRGDLFTYYADQLAFGPSNYDVGDSTREIVTADFDSDQKTDLAIAGSSGVNLLFGDGMGGFGMPVRLRTVPWPRLLLTDDFNSDRNPDLAMINEAKDQVVVLFGDGRGGFSSVQFPAPAGETYCGMGVGDFNGDRRPDLVLTGCLATSTCYVMLANGTGGFSSPMSSGLLNCNGGPVVVADFNSDSKMDLATAPSGTLGTVAVFLGDGMGGFAAPTNVKLGDGASIGASRGGDVNRDNKADLVVLNSNRTLRVLLGNGIGGFTDGGTTTLTGQPSKFWVGDFNGDNKPDLAVIDPVGPVSVLSGDGLGGFAVTSFGTASNATALGVGDLNGDQSADLIVSTGSRRMVSVHLGDGAGNFHSDTIADGQFSRVADFNGDGNQDVVAFSSVNRIRLLLGDGRGGLRAATELTLGANPKYQVEVGDWNSDQKPDLAAISLGGVALFFGDGKGNFTAGALGLLPVVAFPAWSTTGDVNADNVPDIAIAGVDTSGRAGISVLVGNGKGGFSSITNYSAGLAADWIEIADCNRDTKPDLIVVDGTKYSVSVLLGDGMGKFKLRTTMPLSRTPFLRLMLDFNGDDILDLVMPYGDGTGDLLLGDGMGGFTLTKITLPVGSFGTGEGGFGMETGDWNGDQNLDLAIGNSSSLNLLLGNGAGGFVLATTMATMSGPVAVADFNGDHKPDLVLGTYGTSFGTSILLNQSR